MPMHDVACERGREFEALVPLAELDKPLKCPICGAKVERKFPMPRLIKVK